jgi:hypothetical protein
LPVGAGVGSGSLVIPKRSFARRSIYSISPCNSALVRSALFIIDAPSFEWGSGCNGGDNDPRMIVELSTIVDNRKTQIDDDGDGHNDTRRMCVRVLRLCWAPLTVASVWPLLRALHWFAP